MKASRRRSLLGVFALFCTALPAVAQVEMPRMAQSIDVRVTNVDVVVTDSSGKRVHGLTREDFAVYDGGKLQPITNLSEFVIEARKPVPAGAPEPAKQQADVSAAPPRHVVIFFDALSTTREDRRRLSPALIQLVHDLRPDDEAMVVSWNRSLKVVVQPTSDQAALEKGINRAAGEISLRSERLTMFGDIMGDVPNPIGGDFRSSGARRAEQTLEARRRMRESAAELTESIRGLNGIMMRLAGLQGRKALILVSTGFSFRVGANELQDEDEVDSLEWLEGLDAPKLLKALADSANAAGVPIYGIHAQGLHSGWSASASGSTANPYSSDTAALQSIRSSGGGLDGLTYLAARTGGLAAGNVNYFKTAFANISQDLGSYYSIGYRSPDATIDKHRTVDVRPRDKRYTVRSRHGTIDRSTEAEISDRVMAALLFPSAVSNQLGISARVVSVEKRRGNHMKVPVDVTIPLAGLTFQSDGTERLEADLSILIASADVDGSVSTIERFQQRIPITRAQLPTLTKKFHTYKMDVDLRTRGKENRFAIAVLDNVSKEAGLVTVEVKAQK